MSKFALAYNSRTFWTIVVMLVFNCQRRLNIPQFPPVEISPLRRLKFPQVQEDCRHAPAQQASAWMFRGGISIISFPSFRLLSGSPPGRSLPQPHPFQLVHFVLHVLPVVFSHRRFGDLLDKGGEVLQAADEHGSVFASIQQRCVLAGTAEPDGPLEMNQRDSAPIENGRQPFVGGAEVDSYAGRD